MTSPENFNPQDAVAHFQERLGAVKHQMARTLVGQDMIIEGVLMCLMAGGHVLLEGVPGLGKTLMVRALGASLGLDFSRIQFTPDLMPADVTGTNILAEQPDGRREFQFQHGPVFTNLLLADEINRATPKTQSALLEAMQERSVTVAGKTFKLEEPYMVLATQNPVEQEGTYPLPEAQLDRFLFKLKVYFPTLDEMMEILNRTTTGFHDAPEAVLSSQEILLLRKLVREVPIAPHVQEHALRLVLGSHPKSDYSTPNVDQYVRYGSSPRGAQALVLAAKVRALLEGRFHVAYEDIDFVAHPALRHRILLDHGAEEDGVSSDSLIDELIDRHDPVTS